MGPQALGLPNSALSLAREIVPALPGKSPIPQPPPKLWTLSSSLLDPCPASLQLSGFPPLLWLILHTPATAPFPPRKTLDNNLPYPSSGLSCQALLCLSPHSSPAPVLCAPPSLNSKLVFQFWRTTCPLQPQPLCSHCPSAHSVPPCSPGP